MCGGFTCSKNALTALNILYILVAFILIGVAVYGRASALVTNLPIIGGILACGVFLILISILGLIGAIKHHQVLLFFYMLILFLLFLVQFSVACACLAFNAEQQHQLAEQGWNNVASDTRQKVQKTFDCCGFGEEHRNESILTSTSIPQDKCEAACCSDGKGGCLCSTCMGKLQSTINYAFKLCGGIGLFFSFTEVVAAAIAYRYRNQFDPNDKAASAINNRFHSIRVY
ncbi:tetraspanin-13 isoform X1 [Cryptotermes secundus]|nr:tetraspanin-13 isoform X1 [Cryptotermes secundus]